MLAPPAFVSHAQNFEDVMLWRALGHVGRGFYIDVGACEPDAHSVTLAFYERGWSGINIEPAPASFARLDAARPRDVNLQVAAGAAAADADFVLVDGGNGLSTLRTEQAGALAADWPVETVRVAVRPLAEICRDQVRRPIHFLKIDAEGAEREVLEGADLETWRPWVVLVEATEVNSAVPSHEAWEGLLLSRRYRMVYADGLNRFYLAAEHEELASAFDLPPNLFDGFVRATEAAAQAEAAARLARIEQLAAQLAEAQQQAAAFAQQAQDWIDRHADAERRVRTANEALGAAQAIHAADLDAISVAEAERDHAVQEMWESNRLAGILASDRQKLLDQLQSAEEVREAKPLAELSAVYASTSWRLTRPIRAIGRIIGRR